MDCKTARLLLHFAQPLPTELEASEAEALESHLADCPECAALARVERQTDACLGPAMCAVPVPAKLRSQLRTRLDAERGRWYRQRSARILAAAAALGLVLWLGLSWLGQRPDLDLQAFHNDVSQQAGARPEQIEQWFYDRYRIQTSAPADFNYNLLTTYHLADLEGWSVPYLEFLQPEGAAHVYILRGNHFNLKALLEQPRFESGGVAVEVRPHPSDPQIAYLVWYTGGSLLRFLIREQQPAV
jgi:hypothetical protein